MLEQQKNFPEITNPENKKEETKKEEDKKQKENKKIFTFSDSDGIILTQEEWEEEFQRRKDDPNWFREQK